MRDQRRAIESTRSFLVNDQVAGLRCESFIDFVIVVCHAGDLTIGGMNGCRLNLLARLARRVDYLEAMGPRDIKQLFGGLDGVVGILAARALVLSL